MSDDILINVFDEDLDAAEVDRLTLALRRELLEIAEVDHIAAVSSGPAPEGSRAIGLIELGSLLVTVKPTVEALGKVFGVLRGWLASRKASGAESSSVLRITINGQSLELTPTANQQQLLVEEFIRAETSGDRGSSAPPRGGTRDA
jgi:hypothetical protein